MNDKQKIWLSWSSGKDSAYVYYLLQQSDEYEVVGLLTTIESESQRVAMHTTQRILLEMQAANMNLPLHIVELPKDCPNTVYESKILKALQIAQQAGVDVIAFDNIYLQIIREYHEKVLSNTGIKPIFPLWNMDSFDLAREIIDIGIHAVITSINTEVLESELLGNRFDYQFIASLPNYIDPCGENGEFHTFVYDAPFFMNRIAIENGVLLKHNNKFHAIDLKLIF